MEKRNRLREDGKQNVCDESFYCSKGWFLGSKNHREYCGRFWGMGHNSKILYIGAEIIYPLYRLVSHFYL